MRMEPRIVKFDRIRPNQNACKVRTRNKSKKVEILTQIRTINHTKRWTQQTRRWKLWQMQTPRNRGMITNRIKRIPTIGDTTRAAKTTTEHQRRWKICQINNTNGTTDPINSTLTMTHITNHVVGMTKTSMIITTIDEKNNTNQTDQPHQEMNTTNLEMKKNVTNLPIHPRKSHAQKSPEAIWKEQARMEHISRAISRRIRNVKDWRYWWKPNKVEILTQIRTINHTKRWT